MKSNFPEPFTETIFQLNISLRHFDRLYAATFAPAQRMRLYDRGALSSGKLADFLILKDVEAFEIHQIWKKGKLVQQEEGSGTSESAGHFHFPEHFYQSVYVQPLGGEQFRVSATFYREINISSSSIFVHNPAIQK